MRLERRAPEDMGVDSGKILGFYNEVKSLNHELHSFMLLKGGAVISEGWWKPYAPDLPHQMFSLSKSFCSTAVGLASDEGLLSVDDPIVKFFPEEMQALDGRADDKLERMTVKHLLMMATGHSYEPWPEDFSTSAVVTPEAGRLSRFARAFLSGHIKNEPGSAFMYNTSATFMLSAIVQKITGKTLTEYLTPRLYQPLGIQTPYWEQCADGIDFGGFGLNLVTEDIAKFGQLYLQKGLWQGKRIVSEKWIDNATGKRIDNAPAPTPDSDWTQGYGYQFWQCRHGVYRGDGAFGQFCVVMPAADAVVAITSNADLQRTLDLVWKHLLPALTENVKKQPEESHRQLVTVQQNLAVPGYQTESKTPDTAFFSGRSYVEYALTFENPPPDVNITKLALEYSETRREMLLTLWAGGQNAAQPHLFNYKPGSWAEAVSPLPYGARHARAVIRLDWPEAGKLTFINRYILTPFTQYLRLQLTNNTINGQLEYNAGLDNRKLNFTGVSV